MTDKKRHIPMPIITPRLIIREPLVSDAAQMTEAKADSWQELGQWMGWAVGDQPSADDDLKVMKENVEKFQRREDLMMLAFDRAREDYLVASTGLHRFDWDKRIFEIGYWVRTPETGKGIASEITNALLHYAFNALSANEVVICHDIGNIGSQKVIEKFDFVFSETKENFSTLPSGDIVDTRCYRRTNLSGLPELEVSWD